MRREELGWDGRAAGEGHQKNQRTEKKASGLGKKKEREMNSLEWPNGCTSLGFFKKKKISKDKLTHLSFIKKLETSSLPFEKFGF